MSTLTAPAYSSPTVANASPATQALRQSSHPGLRNLTIQEADGIIIIMGRVTSYYLKQLAQETVMPVRGDCTLLNRVTVIKN